MPAALDPQLAMDERAINSPDLEQALERRHRAQGDVAEARGVVRAAKKDIDTLLAGIGDFPPDTALRVGRFRITKRLVEARHVEFDSAEREQVSFSLVDEDGDTKRPSGSRTAKPVSVSDDVDLRPTGDVNTDSLQGLANRSIQPD